MTAPDERVELLAAALRRDAQDLSLYAGFLLTTLAVALPPEVVAVERRRSMRERMRGGEGAIVAVTVALGSKSFRLQRTAVGAPATATVAHQVNGIVLSTQALALDAWSHEVAAALVAEAQVSGRAAAALETMLRPQGL